MRKIEEIKKNSRVSIRMLGIDGGVADVDLGGERPAHVIFSWGSDWDHVSVSYPNRCCTWEEMCLLKDIFFYEDECVVQYHPPKKDYVNLHPYVLHLWRPRKEKIPMPPIWMV